MGSFGAARRRDSCKGVADPCFSINESQHVELVKTNVGDKGRFCQDWIGDEQFGANGRLLDGERDSSFRRFCGGPIA